MARKPKSNTVNVKSKPVNIHLFRAKTSCKIGKEVLDCATQPPPGVTAQEYAIYLLLSAVGDLALYHEGKETKEHGENSVVTGE